MNDSILYGIISVEIQSDISVAKCNISELKVVINKLLILKSKAIIQRNDMITKELLNIIIKRSGENALFN